MVISRAIEKQLLEEYLTGCRWVGLRAKVRCENLEERERDGLELEGWRVDVRVEKPRTSTCGRYMPR